MFSIPLPVLGVMTMAARNLELERPDPDWWSDVAEKCQYATFFHTPLWASFVGNAFPGFREDTLGATLPSGVRVVLPLMESGKCARGILSSLQSAALVTYGGLIADGPVEAGDHEAVYRAALNRGRVGEISVVTNPFAPITPPGLPGSFYEDWGEAQAIRLSGRPGEIFDSFSKTRRYEIRKGRSAGIRTRVAESLDDFRAYFAAYEDSLRRWGNKARTRYPWPVFEAAHQFSLGYPSHLRLWLAELDGDVKAGIVVLYWNRQATYWLSAVHESALAYHPTSVLLADAVDDACRRGFDWFDLMPAGDLKGVEQFKTSFRPQHLSVERYWYTRARLQSVRSWSKPFRRRTRGNLTFPKVSSFSRMRC